jgi:hypothetical protein
VECWGDNRFGQLGRGYVNTIDGGSASTDRDAVPGLKNAIDLASTPLSTCALTEDPTTKARTVWCWGAFMPGQESDRLLASRSPMEVRPPTDKPFARLAPGYVVMAQDEGNQWHRFTGVLNAPVAAEGDFYYFTVPANFECRIEQGSDRLLQCKGWNAGGQLGRGTTENGLNFEPVSGKPTGWSSVGGSQSAVCGVNKGELWCWGSNIRGKLGIPADEGPILTTPHRVGTDGDWVVAEAGNINNCGMRRWAAESGGELWCWGGPFARGPDGGIGGDITLKRVCLTSAERDE